MPKYEVEIEGEVSERVWGFYDVEADSEAEAETIATQMFEDDNYAVDIVGTYTVEIEENE